LPTLRRHPSYYFSALTFSNFFQRQHFAQNSSSTSSSAEKCSAEAKPLSKGVQL
jgi:hypothetical protein